MRRKNLWNVESFAVRLNAYEALSRLPSVEGQSVRLGELKPDEVTGLKEILRRSGNAPIFEGAMSRPDFPVGIETSRMLTLKVGSRSIQVPLSGRPVPASEMRYAPITPEERAKAPTAKTPELVKPNATRMITFLGPGSSDLKAAAGAAFLESFSRLLKQQNDDYNRLRADLLSKVRIKSPPVGSKIASDPALYRKLWNDMSSNPKLFGFETSQQALNFLDSAVVTGTSDDIFVGCLTPGAGSVVSSWVSTKLVRFNP